MLFLLTYFPFPWCLQELLQSVKNNTGFYIPVILSTSQQHLQVMPYCGSSMPISDQPDVCLCQHHSSCFLQHHPTQLVNLFNRGCFRGT